MTNWSDFDAECQGFTFEAGAGLTILDDIRHAHAGSRWLSWDETVALAKWLAEKVAEQAREPAP